MDTHLTSARVQLVLHDYPQFLVDGRPAPMRRKHALALAAYLGLRAQPVGRDTLAALLWPDAAAGIGRGRLRRLVHEVNGALAQRLFGGDADTLWLQDCTSDLRDTQAAMATAGVADLPALCAPRAADLLHGFSFDSELFDDWLRAARGAQQVALAHALRRAIDAALALHDADAAEQGGDALLHLQPCAEAGHIARLAARALRGDAAGVEAAYFEGAARWREEYASRPSARIEAAYAQAQARLDRVARRRRLAVVQRHGTSWQLAA